MPLIVRSIQLLLLTQKLWLTERLECGGPGFELVEHHGGAVVVDRRDGTERGEILEVGEHRERQLLAHVSDLQLAAYQSEVLDRAGSAHRSVTDEGRGLVGPLGVEVVDRV